MRFASRRPLAIGLLFVLLIMAMIPVDQVFELSDLVLEVDCLDFGIVQLGICGVSLACSVSGARSRTFELFLECLHCDGRPR
jgi:hypothetical protein